MPKKRKKTRRARRLDEFFKQPVRGESSVVKEEAVIEDRVDKEEVAVVEESVCSDGVVREVIEDIDSYIEELLKDLGSGSREVVQEESVETVSESESLETSLETVVKEKPVLPGITLPYGEALEELLKLPVGPERGIVCNSNGECSDGHRVSEVFTDKYGFRRQRGFIRTTRLPIYVDWIVEEAVVSKILPTAYKVETNRGAVALVPIDFLCELDRRYGVLLKNYDCSGYKLSIESSRKKR